MPQKQTCMKNKIDLAAEITKYGTKCFQDFEGFTSEKEYELIKKEIRKCAKIFSFKGKRYIQTLCDIVLIKIIAQLNEGDMDILESVDKILETMASWDDILSCRYLLKSGINWNKEVKI